MSRRCPQSLPRAGGQITGPMLPSVQDGSHVADGPFWRACLHRRGTIACLGGWGVTNRPGLWPLPRTAGNRPANCWYFSFGLLRKSNPCTRSRYPRTEADEPQPATGRLEANDPTHLGYRPIQLRRVDWVRLGRETGSSVTLGSRGRSNQSGQIGNLFFEPHFASASALSCLACLAQRRRTHPLHQVLAK